MKALALAICLQIILAAACLAQGPGSSGNNTARAPLYVVNSTVIPLQPALPDNGRGIRPLAAAKEQGHVATYVANEVIYTPKDQADLADFLRRYGGVVVHDSSIPDTPPGLTRRVTAARPTTYTIRLNPSAFDPSKMKDDAAKAGVTIEGLRVSSDDAAKLLAIVFRERSNGTKIMLNLISLPQAAYIYQLPKDSQDSMKWLEFNDTAPVQGAESDICADANFTWHCTSPRTGSNVFKAWQFVAAHGFSYRPKIAIIDAGFWLDAQGNALTDPSGGSPIDCQSAKCIGLYHPWQYNFVAGSYIAQGTNSLLCSKGSACPWQGNSAANVALADIFYNHDGAGTGGLVADPILFFADGSYDEEAQAVETAIAWGADIISMSRGGSCDNWCRGTFGKGDGLSNAIDDATNAGLLVVVSAANDGVDATGTFPCYLGNVLCVGALGDGQSRPRVANDWSSNFGHVVGIWAPTNIREIGVNNSSGLFSGGQVPFAGTSASAPFVAGIAGLMKAINPILKGLQIRDIILSTAYGHDHFSDEVLDNRPDADGNAGREVYRINPYAAVVKAAGGYNLVPDLHIVTPNTNPAMVSSSDSGFVSQTFAAWAYDIDDSGKEGKNPLPANAFHWSISSPSSTSNIMQPSCVDAQNGCLTPSSPFGVSTVDYPFTTEPPGLRTMTVAATNSHNVSASTSVDVLVSFRFAPPLPVIVAPSQAGGTFGIHVPILLEGYARSADPGNLQAWTPCSQMQWITSIGALSPTDTPNHQQDGTCQTTTSFTSIGAQELQLVAWNRLNQKRSTYTNVNIVGDSAFDFAVSLTQPFLVIVAQSAGQSVGVQVTSVSGGSAPVWLKVTGLPSGVSYSFDQGLSTTYPSTPC